MMDFNEARYILTPDGRITENEADVINRENPRPVVSEIEVAYALLAAAQFSTDIELVKNAIRSAQLELRKAMDRLSNK